MTDAERVLNLLIHDVRTPLGVAHGYLRLIREQRLTTPDDRERALVSTQQALGRISRLCEEASGFLAEPTASRRCARALRRCWTACDAVTRTRRNSYTPRHPRRPTMAVGAGVDRLAEAVSTVLRAMARNAPDGVRVENQWRGAEVHHRRR